MVVCSVERLAPGTPTEQTSPAAHLPPLAQDVWPGNISGTNVVVNKCAHVYVSLTSIILGVALRSISWNIPNGP